MNVLVVGTGAIGTLLGISLIRAGCSVSFYDLPQRLEEIRSFGLKLISNGRIYHVASLNLMDVITDKHCFDLALICIKGYSNCDLMKKIPKKVFKRVITVQNGIDNEEHLGNYFGMDRIISGVITLPIARPSLDTIEIANANGGIALAPVKKAAEIETIASWFRTGGLETVIFRDYKRIKWSKLLLNILTNAIPAITAMRPEEVLQNRLLTKIEKLQITEALQVMDRMGIKPVDLPGYPVKLIASFIKNFPPTLIEIAYDFLQKKFSRGSKMPSLYLELESGNTKTENEFLNGAVVKYAAKYDIKVPANKFLYDTMKNIEGEQTERFVYKYAPEKFYRAFLSTLS